MQIALCKRLALLFIALVPTMAGAAIEPRVLGWVEHVLVEPAGFAVKAKLDSGALTSSIHATDIERFERDGDSWIAFTLHGGNGAEQRKELPLVRNVRIKRHRGESQRRAVVKLTLCLGGERREGEFSLIDRSRFNYPVLLGRRFLADYALIDSGASYLAGETCAAAQGSEQ